MKHTKRIIEVPVGMTWTEFADKFGKFFPISDDTARIDLLKSEFVRLTGRTPDEPKKKEQTCFQS